MNMSKRFYQLLLVSLLLITFGTVRAEVTEVIASVDKNPILQGEPFTLTVTVNDDVNQSAWQPEADLADFRILNTRSSRRTSVINGATSRTTSFVVTLQAPIEPGLVRIPPIQIGAAASAEIELTVLDSDSVADKIEQRPAFIRTTIETSEVYVQQQFKLIARLYLSANLHSGNLIAPELEAAEVSQLGKDEESYEIINGKRYQVFQRTYLITPQRSGELTIAGPLFEGQIARETSRSVFSSIATTQPVSAAAPPMKVQVRPRPADWQGHWLPSELVSLTVEQNDSEAELKVGQPLTLTYRLTAIGVPPEQLPELDFSGFTDVSVYPENPQLGSTTRNGQVIAQRSQTIAVIPRRDGTLELPAIEVPWFNTRLGTTQIARTDPLKVKVSPAPQNTPTAATTAATQPEQAPVESQAPSELSTTTERPAVASSLLLYLALTFALLWLVTLALWGYWWLRQQRQPSQPTQQPPSLTANEAWQRLQRAAQNNDASQTEFALRQWAHQHLELTQNDLARLSDYFDHQPLRSQIEHLQRCRYATPSTPWLEGKAFMRALKAACKQLKKPAQASTKLPPLYPE